MNKNLKAGLIVGGVLALLAGYGVYVFKEHAAMTAPAQGVVIESEFVRDAEDSSLDETRISYAYQANGGAFRGSDAISGDDRTAEYPAGKTIEICYNPEEPASSRVNRGGPCAS